jgi:hypothetical protein
MEFDLTQSLTFPFTEPHEDIPHGLLVDAHVVGADSCVLNAVMVSAGIIWVALTITRNNESFEVSSDPTELVRNGKVKFYNGVGKCFGWFLTGDLLVDSLVVQGVSYDLADDVCLPFEGYEPVNQSGLTGDWSVIGIDGITVTPQRSTSLNLSFGTDSDWFTVDSPNYTAKQEGGSVWTINEASGTINFSVTAGKVFLTTDNSKLTDVEFVPRLVFYSDKPDGTYKSYTTFNNIVNDHSWNNGYGATVTRNADGTFKVNLDGTERNLPMCETIVTKIGNQYWLERLVPQWKGCDDNDQLRSVIKTSTELGLSAGTKLPLDDVLEGKVNGGV